MNYRTVGFPIITFLLFSFGSVVLNAQTLFPEQGGAQSITAGVEAEAGTLFTVGYQHSVYLKSIARDISFHANVTVPSGKDLFNDLRIRIGARTFLSPDDGLNVSAGMAITGIRSSNHLLTATGFGLDVTLTAGYYGSAWFAAAETGVDRTFLANISFTDYYRDYFFGAARDGWYRNTAGNIHLGVRGGIRTGRAELGIRTGLQTTLELESRVLPFYAGLWAGYRL